MGQRGTSNMQLSRWLAAGSAVLMLAATAALPQSAQAREIVGFSGAYAPGTVVVRTGQRSLYYVLGNGRALRYPVGVGRAGKPAVDQVLGQLHRGARIAVRERVNASRDEL